MDMAPQRTKLSSYTMLKWAVMLVLMLGPSTFHLSGHTAASGFAHAQKMRITNEEGQAFLKAKAEEEDTVSLENGIVYKVLKAGTGSAKPELTDTVELHFRAKTVNGDEVDSSYGKGGAQQIIVNQHAMKGIRAVLPLMTKDSKWEVYLPSELAFGRRGAGRIVRPGDVIVCTLHLIEIGSAEAKKAKSKRKGKREL